MASKSIRAKGQAEDLGVDRGPGGAVGGGRQLGETLQAGPDGVAGWLKNDGESRRSQACSRDS